MYIVNEIYGLGVILLSVPAADREAVISRPVTRITGKMVLTVVGAAVELERRLIV